MGKTKRWITATVTADEWNRTIANDMSNYLPFWQRWFWRLKKWLGVA